MRARTPLSVLSFGVGCMLLFGGGQGCGDAAPPPSRTLSLRAGTTTVEIATGAFGLSFVQDGERVTGTIARGDDAHAPAMAAHEVLEEQGRGLPGWDGYAPVVGPWALSGRARVLSETGDSARVAIEAPGGEVELTVSVRARRVELIFEAKGGAPAWNKLGLTLGAAPDEHFFGMGERFASTDHRGLALYSWAEEGGVGKGESAPRAYDNPGPNGPSMTYFPVPFFLSSRGFGVHLDTTFRTAVDFAERRADALTLTADTARLRVVVYLSRDPKDSLGAFVADTGRPFVPAPWVFGPRRRVGVNAMVDGVPEWKLLRDRDIPITTIDDAVHFLPARSEAGREETLREWTRTVHAAGYKVVAYVNPYVATAPEIADDFAYGRDRGLFLTEPSGKPGLTIFSSGRLLELASIDLTQPEGVAWFQSLLRRPLALGYDGWMHDFGEYTERRWRAKDGRTGVELHNLYPVLSAKAAHELLEKERPGDYLFFVRVPVGGWHRAVVRRARRRGRGAGVVRPRGRGRARRVRPVRRGGPSRRRRAHAGEHGAGPGVRGGPRRPRAAREGAARAAREVGRAAPALSRGCGESASTRRGPSRSARGDGRGRRGRIRPRST
ncbi:MAG: hypothetical protein IPF92_07080 [Myxococcales bacterium]|nr:hypothetical protein [Myxococcales bacterium]